MKLSGSPATATRKNTPPADGPPGLSSNFKKVALIALIVYVWGYSFRWRQACMEKPMKATKATKNRMMHLSCQEVLPSWIWNMSVAMERKVYSQFGEDGITEYLMQHLPGPAINPFYVEFGVQNGTECNTRFLREQHGWKGIQMDGSYDNADIGLHQHWIHPQTIVSLFKKYNVPHDLGLLSEDTDYADFFLWKAMLEAGYQARILIGEVNGNFLPNEAATVQPPPLLPATKDETGNTDNDIKSSTIIWGGKNYFGVSALALSRLWNKHGYLMIYCTRNQVNCFGLHMKDVLLDAKQQQKAKHISDSQLLELQQQCLWEKPIAWFFEQHPCDMNPASVFRKVDRFGRLTDEEYEPWFLQQCRKKLGPWKNSPLNK